MIRFVNCLRRRGDLTPAEFRRYWEDPAFDALIERAAGLTSAVRHAKTLTLQVEANLWVMAERGSGEPFDGVLEYWWESAGHLDALRGTDAVRALQAEMRAWQEQFVDLEGSVAFFAESKEG